MLILWGVLVINMTDKEAVYKGILKEYLLANYPACSRIAEKHGVGAIFGLAVQSGQYADAVDFLLELEGIENEI